MARYVIDDTFHSFDSVQCDDISKAKEKDNLILTIVSRSTDNNLAKLYAFLREALQNHNRILLIGIRDDNKSFEALSSLLISYKNYDIYSVDNKDVISVEYVDKIENRHPDYSEVQTYIGGDKVAYSDLSITLFGLQSLVEEGNIEALKEFVDKNSLIIENSVSTINKMKKICDVFNEEELIKDVKNLKSNLDTANDELKQLNNTLEDTKADRDSKVVELKEVKKQLNEANSKISAPVEVEQTTRISTFKTVDTRSEPNKAKIILYFKEVTYVRYMNTLIGMLQQFMQRKKLKTKTIIYDTTSELCKVYDPLRVVDGKLYLESKDALFKDECATFVVTEPAQNIISDVLNYGNGYDVVIIYDRMHTTKDIVDGNLVTKFYVINSRSDYESIKNTLKINDVSHIITSQDSSINLDGQWKKVGDRDFLYIPTIGEYAKKSRTSTSFSFTSYIKLGINNDSTNNKALIDTILDMSKINTLYNG